jgi:hypothetical protein
MDIFCPAVRTASTTSSTGWLPEALTMCGKRQATNTKTKKTLKAFSRSQPFLSELFARISRAPEIEGTRLKLKTGLHQGLLSGRRGTRTPGLSRVKAAL